MKKAALQLDFRLLLDRCFTVYHHLPEFRVFHCLSVSHHPKEIGSQPRPTYFVIHQSSDYGPFFKLEYKVRLGKFLAQTADLQLLADL